jgi:hypothetical protein
MANKLKISICVSGHQSTSAPSIKIFHNQRVITTAQINEKLQWIDFNIVPKVYIDKVFVDEQIGNYDASKYLSPKTSKISIQLGISGMLTQENIRSEYKIDDDKNWNTLLINNANLTIEKPGFGSHKVSIRTRSSFNDKWEYAYFDFNVDYPWYLYPWMYLVYLFGMFGLLLLASYCF